MIGKRLYVEKDSTRNMLGQITRMSIDCWSHTDRRQRRIDNNNVGIRAALREPHRRNKQGRD